MTSETCQVCGKTKNVNESGHCQGHDNPASSKQRLDAIRSASPGARAPVAEAPSLSLKEQLDAIPTPGTADGGAAPAAEAPAAEAPKRGPGSILGRKTNPGAEDMKGALDAIPTPGEGGGAGPGLGAVSKDALDAIPTPGGGGSPADAGIPKSALDAIPSPGAGGNMAAQLDSIPAPGAGAGPAEQNPPGEVPQWMKNFEQHQASISASQYGGGGGGGGRETQSQYGAPASGYGGGGYGGPAPDSVPQSYGASRGGADAPPQSGGYTMIIGIVILACIIMFGYLMISKPEPPVMPDVSSPTPASTAPSTPYTP